MRRWKVAFRVVVLSDRRVIEKSAFKTGAGSISFSDAPADVVDVAESVIAL